MPQLLWVDGPHGELLLATSFDAALAGIYPDDYDLSRDSHARGADRRQEQRDQIADRAATAVQGLALLALADDGEFNPDEEGEEVLTALFSERSEPAPLAAWNWWPGERLPLILTSAAVAMRQREDPTDAGVTVLDARSARRLMGSLAHLGVIRFGTL